MFQRKTKSFAVEEINRLISQHFQLVPPRGTHVDKPKSLLRGAKSVTHLPLVVVFRHKSISNSYFGVTPGSKRVRSSILGMSRPFSSFMVEMLHCPKRVPFARNEGRTECTTSTGLHGWRDEFNPSTHKKDRLTDL